MFTGIIQHCGIITRFETLPDRTRMDIDAPLTDLKLGESIAVDGICLTVSGIHAQGFSAELSPETMQVTTAKHFFSGFLVNLERPLRLSDFVGGHLVSGHIDQTIQVMAKEIHSNQCTTLKFKCNRNFLIAKGSVAINGVSLTVNEVNAESFSVTLIPFTLAHTNLGKLALNDWVNVEFDMLVKIVVQLK